MNDIAIHEKEVISAVEQARSFVIKTDDDFRFVDAHCSGLLKLKQKIESDFEDSKKKSYAAWKSVVAQEKGHLDGIEEARRIDKSKLGIYQDEQEAIRVKEEARLREVARKEAEEAALNAAIEAESSGDTEGASAIMAEPVIVAPVVLSKSVPKVSTSIPRPWTFRVVNLALVPRAYLMLDEVKLGQQARATKDTIKIPGIEFFQRPA